MKIFITVQHIVSLDHSTKEFLQSLFPDRKEIKDLTGQIKNDTQNLKNVVDQSTPQT